MRKRNELQREEAAKELLQVKIKDQSDEQSELLHLLQMERVDHEKELKARDEVIKQQLEDRCQTWQEEGPKMLSTKV